MLRESLEDPDASIRAVTSLLQTGSPLYPATLGDRGREGKMPSDPFAREFATQLRYMDVGNVREPCRLSWHLMRSLIRNGETLPDDLAMMTIDSGKPCIVSAYEWLLRQWMDMFRIEYSYCHFPNLEEMAELYECGVLFSYSIHERRMPVFVPCYLLDFFLPNLFWSQTFGPTYVALFGKERLLSCPAYSVLEWPNGSISIQLTAEMSDTQNSLPEFREARANAKAHLGDDINFSEEKGRFGKYLTPDFGLSPRPPHLQQLRPLLDLQGVLKGQYNVFY